MTMVVVMMMMMMVMNDYDDDGGNGDDVNHNVDAVLREARKHPEGLALLQFCGEGWWGQIDADADAHRGWWWADTADDIQTRFSLPSTNKTIDLNWIDAVKVWNRRLRQCVKSTNISLILTKSSSDRLFIFLANFQILTNIQIFNKFSDFQIDKISVGQTFFILRRNLRCLLLRKPTEGWRSTRTWATRKVLFSHNFISFFDQDFLFSTIWSFSLTKIFTSDGFPMWLHDNGCICPKPQFRTHRAKGKIRSIWSRLESKTQFLDGYSNTSREVIKKTFIFHSVGTFS